MFSNFIKNNNYPEASPLVRTVWNFDSTSYWGNNSISVTMMTPITNEPGSFHGPGAALKADNGGFVHVQNNALLALLECPSSVINEIKNKITTEQDKIKSLQNKINDLHLNSGLLYQSLKRMLNEGKNTLNGLISLKIECGDV
ncbi:MAG: hypothetical protein QE271_06770 [Bacteriovoracaceae bacterium]|nr:hypothetical protein [Bacteriovoracaceae bacterium]